MTGIELTLNLDLIVHLTNVLNPWNACGKKSHMKSSVLKINSVGEERSTNNLLYHITRYNYKIDRNPITISPKVLIVT